MIFRKAINRKLKKKRKKKKVKYKKKKKNPKTTKRFRDVRKRKGKYPRNGGRTGRKKKIKKQNEKWSS